MQRMNVACLADSAIRSPDRFSLYRALGVIRKLYIWITRKPEAKVNWRYQALALKIRLLSIRFTSARSMMGEMAIFRQPSTSFLATRLQCRRSHSHPVNLHANENPRWHDHLHRTSRQADAKRNI